MSGGPHEAIKQFRAEGLLPDADWDEVQNLGILDAIFVANPETGFVTAVALLSDAAGSCHPWVLAERPSMESARLAVRFLLQGLAALRRLTGQKYPWAPETGDADTDAQHAQARRAAVDAAIDRWCQRANDGIAAASFVAARAAREEERRVQALAGAPIREARRRWKLTQANLAERAEIKVAVLSEIERGMRVPDDETRARLADALDGDVATLFSGFAERS